MPSILLTLRLKGVSTVRFTVIVLALLAGCSAPTSFVTREYTWIQREDGIGMKAPITYTVRYQWVHDTLYWNVKAVDAEGLTDIQRDEYAVGSQLVPCQFWDDNNWRCEFRAMGGEPPVWVAMNKGQLKWFYWTELRAMKPNYVIFGHSF
jgi:hypothetical protein